MYPALRFSPKSQLRTQALLYFLVLSMLMPNLPCISDASTSHQFRHMRWSVQAHWIALSCTAERQGSSDLFPNSPAQWREQKLEAVALFWRQQLHSDYCLKPLLILSRTHACHSLGCKKKKKSPLLKPRGNTGNHPSAPAGNYLPSKQSF